jgi:hypothetical protein
MRKKDMYLGLMMALALPGCGANVDGTKERATAEQEAARDVENKNLRSRAEQLESYLGVQHKLYGAIEGEFEGTVMVNGEAAKLRMVLTRSIQEYLGNRTRLLSEIEGDINGLRFNVIAQQWHPRFPGSTVGCSYALVRPNFNQGQLGLQPASANSECRLTYKILLSAGEKSQEVALPTPADNSKWGELHELARGLGARLNSGDYRRVEALVGTVQSTFGETAFAFDIRRVR